MISNQRLVAEFQGFIDRWKFDICLALTFRQETKLAEAIKRFKFFFKHLNTKEEQFFSKFIRCWVFYGTAGEHGVHIHALIQGIAPHLANRLEEKCSQFFGNTVVEPYDYNFSKARSMSRYLSRKYLSTRLQDFDYYKINSRLRGIPL
jgi:hypothetical protein